MIAPEAVAPPPADGGRSRPALAVAGFSAAIFLVQVLLTRVFSVTLFHHFAFAAISVAMLGLASAGVHLALAPERFRAERSEHDIVRAAVLFAATGLLAVVILVHFGIYPLFSWGRLLGLLGIYFICAIPFYFGGLGLSLLFTHHRANFSRLYAMDLVAAGLSGLAVAGLLRYLGGPGAVVAGFLIALVTGLLAFPRVTPSLRRLGLLVLVAGALLLLADKQARVLRLRQPKEVAHLVDRTVFERWNILSRVAVYDSPHQPWSLGPRYQKPLPLVPRMDIDAEASTPIVSLRHGEGNDYLRYELVSLAYVVAPKDRTLVIGAGGGRDVLSALLHGVRHVDAVEINRIIVDDVMRGGFFDWSGRLYADPRVSAYVADGRSFMRASTDRYDVIQLSLVDTWAATAAGALALSENSLYTDEAVREYLEHLSPDGVLTMTRWKGGEVYRLVVLIHAAARSLGIQDLGRHLAIVQHHATPKGEVVAVNVLFRRSPFDEASVAALRAQVDAAGFDWLHDPLRTLPGRFPEIANAADALAEGRRTEDYDLSPPTDDRPFFFYRARPFLAGIAENPRRILTEGQYLIAAALCLAALLATLTLIVPLFRRGRAAVHEEPRIAMVGAVYFLGIGVGFMLVEIAIMQRFVLYLGHPTPALTAVVSGLLVGAGIGSGLSSRLGGGRRAPIAAAAAAALVLLFSNAAHPWLFATTQHYSFPMKVVLTEALVMPLGIVLGTLMPLGIARILHAAAGLVPWAWGVNGFASVVGACAGALLAVAFGFSFTLKVGAACYALAGLAAFAHAASRSAAPSST